MVGILIVAHGGLGDSLIQCASHVLGQQPPRLEALGVSGNDEPDALLRQARALVNQLDEGDGVLIFTDMYGATPSNVICSLMEPGRTEGVAGVSLPMLVRAITYRNEPILTVVAKALSGGSEGVVHITTEICHVASKG